MNTENKTTALLEDVKVNVKIVLAALWAAHFLLWTFGDMASLLQEFTEPIDNNLLLLVAVPLAITQVLMVLFSLVGKAKLMRWVNIILALVFLLFNVGFLAEAHVGWEYLLGAGYLLFNGLVVWYAWRWPKQEA
ncbi:MAG: hypothetical protein DWQ07_11110 [Chloroflexi bacterium]|nr:MAG: hypothetical protein DWQ07_11110 [Chloroflexota bacterium]MBL1192736.1 hypothetical protein [Chloroflexota bacterium]NOH10028.1 hypothetical protein [Chloroflexota bacterium]